MPSLLRALPMSRSSTEIIMDDAHIEPITPKNKKRFSLHALSRVGSDIIRSPSESSTNNKPAVLEFQIESPPVVCYGPTTDSVGALLAGQLWLCIGHKDTSFNELTLHLQQITTTRKPVAAHCADCAQQVENMQTWRLITSTTPVKSGEHNYPFSYLLSGSTPASTSTTLGSIKYMLTAKGVMGNGEVLKISKEVVVSRSILPGPDKNSLRIFPPTDLTSSVILPSIIHRGTPINVQMAIDGLVNEEKNTRWRLRKLVWRIDETTKMVSHACKEHNFKIGGEGKGVLHNDMRTLTCAELKRGWKSDLSGKGKVELEFEIGIPPRQMASNGVEQVNGLSVTHNLVVEMIVAEEYIPKGTKIITPTGAARVLRMQFKLTVTEHSGMGIPWDEECPPLYDDVPRSPPTYATLLDGLPEYFDTEQLSAPNSPPLPVARPV